jgi:hypothetical protein
MVFAIQVVEVLQILMSDLCENLPLVDDSSLDAAPYMEILFASKAFTCQTRRILPVPFDLADVALE